MKSKEFNQITNMLKIAIKQEREFTNDESKKFNDLFETVIKNDVNNYP